MTQCPTEVFIDCIPSFLRPRNTDWRYGRYSIPRLPEFTTGIKCHVQSSRSVTIRANGIHIYNAIAQRTGLGGTILPYVDTTESFLSQRELADSQAHVVYSHRGFPCNAGSIPVIWHYAQLDPLMLTAKGIPERDIIAERDRLAEIFARAAYVQVPTATEAERHKRDFPKSADRFVAIPFLLPDLEPIQEADVIAKHRQFDLIRIIFVGSEARRKGLDVLYDQLESLAPSIRKRIHLTVVSAFQDGEVARPINLEQQVFRGLPHADTMRLMQRSHILAVPSRFESHGLVFVEAMATGAIPIAPSWEPQRDIVDNGKAGLCCRPDTMDLAQYIDQLVSSQPYREELAIAGLKRFKTTFAREVVAGKYKKLFEAARVLGERRGG